LKDDIFGLCLETWKALDKEGLHGLGSHGVWTCRAKVLEDCIISSLKIKLN
jgi:hypothetical protein